MLAGCMGGVWEVWTEKDNVVLKVMVSQRQAKLGREFELRDPVFGGKNPLHFSWSGDYKS